MRQQRGARACVLGFVLAVASCDRPEFEPFERSVAAYDAGRVALEAGRAEEAVARFAEARTADPGSASLALWEARALAAANRFDEAEARLSELLARAPGDGTVWYNRGAYRARAAWFALPPGPLAPIGSAGALEGAASDLREAIRLGVATPFQAAADPDFRAVRGSPAFADVLPSADVVAGVRGPDGSVFIGSRFDVVLSVKTLPSAPLALRQAGPDVGCVKLVRVVEDGATTPGLRAREIRLGFEAVAPCTAALGPFRLRSGDSEVEVASVALVVEGPSDAARASSAAAYVPREIPLPGEALAPADGAAGVRIGEGIAAMAASSVAGAATPPDVALEARERGQTVARGGFWRDPSALRAEARP